MSLTNTIPAGSEFEHQLAAMLVPDYVVREARIEPDDSAAALAAVRSVIAKLQDRADLAWAGARIAQVLREHPWLAACKITISCSSEYNDQGGTYLSRWLGVSGVKPLAQAQIPEDLCVDTGGLDEDAATDRLNDALSDDVAGLADAFMEPYEDSEHEVLVDRALVADLIASPSPISGAAAAERLWPDCQHRLAATARSAVQPTADATSSL
jgi:hypothetical protein